jgi:4-alpha-glucanotransferase
MEFPRRSGILLHPTSLPGSFGVGDLGPSAYRFIDWLVAAGQTLWQVLPLGPTGYGDSPYQAFSAFAGNPLLISPEWLLEQQLLTESELAAVPIFETGNIDFGAVIPWKDKLLRAAYARFATQSRPEFERWTAANAEWLDDYALFTALKGHFGGGAWTGWDDDIRARDPKAIARYTEILAEEIGYQKFLQSQFAQQWTTLRAYARQQGVDLVGDMPIFIAHDSADAWAHKELFTLQEDGSLEVQAGVPPDYFAATGQLWGNPLYRWDAMAAQGYSWWIDRFRSILNLVDMVRLDHFRGFEAAWAIPGGAPNAINGEWRKGPEYALFDAINGALGEMPIIAEDLGVITPDVEALRDRYNFPGMRILQFGFTADAKSEFLPHSYIRNCVAYTGTHDNETTRGWFDNLDARTRERVLAYFESDSEQVVFDMVRAIIASVAATAIIPMQDILDLGNEARINTPGLLGNNWQWRATAADFTPDMAAALKRLALLYGRVEA